ncbi:hypothetical protein [Bacillus nitroreducens]
MNVLIRLCIGLIFLFIVTGCIGEEYDFSPPTITLSSNSNIESEELVEANIDWRGEENKPIEKETENIEELAKQQQQMYFTAGEKVDLLSDHADFKLEELRVSIWQNDHKLDLEVTDISFDLPKEKGEYVIEVNLQTDRGKAQYVENVVIN